jgi:hypothetical protein
VVEGERAAPRMAAQVRAIGRGGVGFQQVKFQHGAILLRHRFTSFFAWIYTLLYFMKSKGMENV